MNGTVTLVTRCFRETRTEYRTNLIKRNVTVQAVTNIMVKKFNEYCAGDKTHESFFKKVLTEAYQNFNVF